MNWYMQAVKKYAVFSGRSRRKEYWFFALFYLIFSIACGIVDMTIGTMDADSGMGMISGLFALAMLLPSIAVTIRRLHDTGRSGWWLLIILIPILGGIALLVFMCFNSSPGDNEYGPNPKEVPAPA